MYCFPTAACKTRKNFVSVAVRIGLWESVIAARSVTALPDWQRENSLRYLVAKTVSTTMISKQNNGVKLADRTCRGLSIINQLADRLWNLGGTHRPQCLAKQVISGVFYTILRHSLGSLFPRTLQFQRIPPSYHGKSQLWSTH